MSITRRNLIAGALAVSVVAPAGPVSAAPARLRLPGPTGPYRVGTTTVHLLDRSRPDPFTGERIGAS